MLFLLFCCLFFLLGGWGLGLVSLLFFEFKVLVLLFSGIFFKLFELVCLKERRFLCQLMFWFSSLGGLFGLWKDLKV